LKTLRSAGFYFLETEEETSNLEREKTLCQEGIEMSARADRTVWGDLWECDGSLLFFGEDSMTRIL
jgi:hypothetical protein